MPLEESWNMEVQKAEFFKNKDIKWQDYFISEDFLKEDLETLKLKYRKIYKSTQFKVFQCFIPAWIPYDIVLNCGVGGYYNETEKIIYISVNPGTSINTFYDTLMHEYCHIECNKYLACTIPKGMANTIATANNSTSSFFIFHSSFSA